MWRTALILAGSLLLAGCGTRGLARQVQDTAEKLNQDYITIRTALEELNRAVTRIYNHPEELDLTPRGVDVSEGGLFTAFEGNKFYYKITNSGAAYYLSPLRPVDDSMKQAIRQAGYAEPALEKAHAAMPGLINTAYLGFSTPYTLALLYPWIDVVSVFPPGIPMEVFEWFRAGMALEKGPAWSPVPFTDLYSGWVMDVYMPVKKAGTNISLTLVSTSLRKAVIKYLEPSRYALLLLGPELSLLGVSAPARDILELKVLEDIDYVRQMKENTFIRDEFKLDHAGQTPVLQELAGAIRKGDSTLRIKEGGYTYHFVIARIPETGLYLVGVERR